MIVGFTGTRQGLSDNQLVALTDLLFAGGITGAHHGVCVGADAEFHNICRTFGIPVVGHPPSDTKLLADLEGFAFLRVPKPYLERDDEIIKECHLLIATPKEDAEPGPARGQGTWTVVRHARKANKPTVILWP